MASSVDVLVVDDRAIDADVTLFALRRAAPTAKVLRLKSGEEALQYLFSVGDFARGVAGMPRLVLLDAEMPVMSGLCVLDVVRAHPRTAGIRVVMLSTDAHAHVFRPPDTFAADAYVVKPVDLDRYCASIETILRRWLPQVLMAQGPCVWREDHASASSNWGPSSLYPT